MSHFDIFLSHDWGTDQEGRNNHDRVAMLNTMLKAHGFETWFDEERMTGHVVQQMCNGIEGSQSVLVFITKNYLAKVNSEHDDNCKKEFNYSVMRKTTKRMIPIIMEDAAKDTRAWVGPVGMELGSHLYINMSTNERMRGALLDLVKRLKEMGIEPSSRVSKTKKEAATEVPKNISYIDGDGDAICFMVTPEGIGKFVNKKYKKTVTKFGYRPIDGDLRDQELWGGRINKKDRERVINGLRLMCAEVGVPFISYEAVTYIDGDGDTVLFTNSCTGLRKYVNGKFSRMVKSLRYRKADHDLRDQAGWGGKLPTETARRIIDDLSKTCRNIGVVFTFS